MSPWLIRFTCRARPHGGVRKLGVPNSWMVYNGKSHMKMDENWGLNGLFHGKSHMKMDEELEFGMIWRVPPWLFWKPQMETSDSSPNLPLNFLGNTACPGLILMYRFYKDVSHVELIIGESGLRPDPRASSTLFCFFSAIFGVPTMWEPLSTPKYGKPLRDQQVSRYPLGKLTELWKITIFKSYVGLPEGNICFPRSL